MNEKRWWIAEHREEWAKTHPIDGDRCECGAEYKFSCWYEYIGVPNRTAEHPQHRALRLTAQPSLGQQGAGKP